MPCHHLTLTTRERLPIARDEAHRRRIVARLAEGVCGPLVLFCLADDHLHLVLEGSRERVGRLAREISQSLRWQLGQSLAPSHLRPVASRRHLRTLVDYVLGQPHRHGLGRHPALWTGSCFQDLVGARSLPKLRLRLPALVPRLRPGDLFRAVGLDPETLAIADATAIRRAGAERVVAAAAAALCVTPSLAGNHPAVVRARRAAVAAADGAGIRTAETAAALALTTSGVRRLRSRREDRVANHALGVRLSLELACRSAGRDEPATLAARGRTSSRSA